MTLSEQPGRWLHMYRKKKAKWKTVKAVLIPSHADFKEEMKYAGFFYLH